MRGFSLPGAVGRLRYGTRVFAQGLIILVENEQSERGHRTSPPSFFGPSRTPLPRPGPTGSLQATHLRYGRNTRIPASNIRREVKWLVNLSLQLLKVSVMNSPIDRTEGHSVTRIRVHGPSPLAFRKSRNRTATSNTINMFGIGLRDRAVPQS